MQNFQPFKQWQLLRESLFPLGLSNPNNVSGVVGNNFQQKLDEKKKHMDVNPEEDIDVDDADDEIVDDDDDGDEDVGPKEKDSCGEGKFCKKKMQKKMKNECGCDEKGKKNVEMDDDADDDADVDADAGDGEEIEDDEEGGADMKRPLGFMKKKGMKKKMKKEATNPQDEFMKSFNSYTAPTEQSTTEDAWWQSVTSHFSNPNQKFSDGFSEYMEDYLIDPEAQKNFLNGGEPKPGDVGAAPQQRMGWFGSQIDGGSAGPLA